MSKLDLIGSGLQQGLLVSVRIYDRKGRFLREIVQPAHSYVVAWPSILNFQWNNSVDTTATDTGGTLRTLNGTGFILANGAAAATTKGIVLGTGTNAVAMTDTALQTQIAEGTGAGQLSHGAVQFYPVDSAGANPRYVNISRGFQNNSGASISPTEVGLYVTHTTTTGSPASFCVCRDLLSFSVGIGQLAIVQYQLIFNLT